MGNSKRGVADRFVNVLWVSPYSVFGGPHNAILQVAEPLKARGWESLVLLPTDPGNAAERLQAGGVETVQLPFHHLQASVDPRVHLSMASAFRSEVARIAGLISERRVDLVVLTGVDLQAAMAARRTGTAIVWQVLASRPPRPVRAAWMTLIRRWADSTMFSGHAIERMYVGRRPLKIQSYQWIPPADPNRFQPSETVGAATRARLGVPRDVPFVGSVANLVPMKGIEFFVRGAAIIHRHRPDSWFLIAGSSYPEHEGYPARLREEIKKSGVPRERFVWVDELPDALYPALDLMVIASLPRSEGTTTTAVEAMTCETPVIATNIAALHEVVIDGLTGVIVPPCDADAIAEATLSLLGDPGRMRELGVQGRRRMIERNTPGLCADAHIQAFEAALSHHS